MINSQLDDTLASIDAGKEVAYAIKDALHCTPANDKEELCALASRIKLCNSKENHWISPEIWSYETGEAFSGRGKFWSCGSKLCPGCLRRQSQRNRRQLRQTIESLKIPVGQNLYFVTLTIPNPGVSLSKTLDIVQYAWSLFRKRQYFGDRIKGGARCVEFTVTKIGYHVHLHLIVQARSLHYDTIRHLWTECVSASFLTHRREFYVNTKDRALIAQVKPIDSLKSAMNEVCKYITKSDSWRKVRPDDLLEIARIRRWRRMFEMFGSFRNVAPDLSIQHDIDRERKTILDTSDVSDGEAQDRSDYWRDAVRKLGFESYIDRLFSEFIRCKTVRSEQLKMKYPNALIIDLTHLAETEAHSPP